MDWPEFDSRSENDSAALLRRLLELGYAVGARARAPDGRERLTAGLASFFRLASAWATSTEARSLESPWLSLVLAGCMEVRGEDHRARAEAGELLVLPARRALEVTLWPPASGVFHALEIELLAEALARRPPVGFAFEPAAGVPQLLRPGRGALAALIGFCESVLEPTTHPRVLEHQLEGVLLVLALETRGDPAAVERERAQLDLTLAIRQLVHATPDSTWSLHGVARRLGLSPATLRRRLAERGTGLRRLVQEERMLVGRTLLGDGRLNVGEVATRCGYGSPAKFSRQFKQTFGVVPSHYRRGQPSPGFH
jgi:AraC-like DNA-binding protein